MPLKVRFVCVLCTLEVLDMYKEYWCQLSDTQRKSMAKKLKTSTGYLRLVITGHKIPGAALAKNLHDITNGEVDKHQLRPDIF